MDITMSFVLCAVGLALWLALSLIERAVVKKRQQKAGQNREGRGGLHGAGNDYGYHNRYHNGNDFPKL